MKVVDPKVPLEGGGLHPFSRSVGSVCYVQFVRYTLSYVFYQ